MLATRRSAPDHLGLVSVKLKSVGPHPPTNVTYAIRNTALELGTVTRLTEAVYLRVVSVEVWVKAMCTNKSEQICSVQKKQNRSENRSLWDTANQLGPGR